MAQKLVRDRIPELMELAGVKSDVIVLGKAQRLQWLLKKLAEEAAELTADPNLEECADVLEVVMAIAEEVGHSRADVLKAADEKLNEKGGFSRGFVILVENSVS